MKYLMRFVAVTAVVLTLGACGTYVKVRNLTPDKFAATTECAVFTAGAPDRPFIELALIEVSEGGDVFKAARAAAMKLGADAIIMKGTEVEEAIQVAPGLTGTANKTIFVAIKYK